MNGMAVSDLVSMTSTVLCSGVYSGTIYVTNCDPSWKPDDFKRSGPAWERWFDIFRQPAQIKKLAQHGVHIRRRRDPARKCVKDACRWKRRRFVQRLAA